MTQNMPQDISITKLLRFTLPTMGMMLFMSAYVIADGFFVSNYCGATALAAVNFAYPVPMILSTVGFMLGTGGGAIVAKTRGEGDEERANRQFSLFVYAALALGVISGVIGVVALKPLMIAFGAQGDMLELSVMYGLVVCAGVPFTVLQYLFQELMVTAGKPDLAFGVTIAAGITNIVLDALLIVAFNWGVVGAAVGTMLGEAVGGVIPIVYFALPNDSALHLGRTRLNWREIGHACVNGSSEMVSNIALSIVSIAYNVQLLRYLGEPGVAAYGVIMYVAMAFAALFIGYTVGASPLMSFQYGARNKAEMRRLFRKSLAIIAVLGIAMFAATRVAASPIAHIFVSYDADLEALTVHAFSLYSLAFLFMGFNIYGSALFTSLDNGLVSAAISFFRTLICEIGAVLLLPLVLGPDGIWLSVVAAEIAALIVTGGLVIWLAPNYGYARSSGELDRNAK